eukprot:2995806-Amphidinium_carterae.1
MSARTCRNVRVVLKSHEYGLKGRCAVALNQNLLPARDHCRYRLHGFSPPPHLGAKGLRDAYLDDARDSPSSHEIASFVLQGLRPLPRLVSDSEK